jgi:nicotinic acid phosphoribosyltransferase
MYVDLFPTSSFMLNTQVYLALKYGLKPIGTIAHEWIMAVGATYGYKGVNSKAMDLWEEGKSNIRFDHHTNLTK